MARHHLFTGRRKPKYLEVFVGYQGIYLDANATTSPLDEVVAIVARTMRSSARNPASSHAFGTQARRMVESARDEVCRSVEGAEPDGVVFLSGGTEANNTIVRAFCDEDDATFLAAPIEHSSLIQPLRRTARDRVSWLRVDGSGRVDVEDAGEKARCTSGRLVLAVQAANGETGVIQPLRAVVSEVRRFRPDAFVHVDAAQAIGRIRLSFAELDADSLSFSAHKLHGPMGVGALVLRDPDEDRIAPLVLGGGQERSRRSGTSNVPGIVGMAKALELRRESFDPANRDLARMRDAFEDMLVKLLGQRVLINAAGAERVSNTSNVRFEGVDGMRLLALLDQDGVMASLGSACASGRPEPSPVLLAMGLTEKQAFSSVRFSFSILNTMDEALQAAEIAARIARDIAR